VSIGGTGVALFGFQTERWNNTKERNTVPQLAGSSGNAKNHPGAGAAIGGGVGLRAGALIGNYIQSQEDDDYRR
jgi:hypothetical protein